MKLKEKVRFETRSEYLAPTCKVVCVHTRQVICNSIAGMEIDENEQTDNDFE